MAGSILDDVCVELAGQVLRWLTPADLHNARLACRLFDAASRAHLGRGLTMALTAANAGAERGRPDFSRFPNIRTLRLTALYDFQVRQLFTCFQAAGPRGGEPAAVLSRVAALDLRFLQGGAASVVALLRLAPGATEVAVPTRWRGAAGAHPFSRDDGADEAAAWAALPRDRLSSLRASCGLPTSLWAAPWPRLRELRGVQLPCHACEPLARAAPQLTLLVAHATGAWGASAAVLPLVTRARLTCCEGFFERPGVLGRLLPSVQHLVLRPLFDLQSFGKGGAQGLSELSGLTCLTHLCFRAAGRTPRAIPWPEHSWAALAGMAALQHLSCDLDTRGAPRLVRALPALRALEVRLAFWGAGGDDDGGTAAGQALGQALRAFGSLTGLQALGFDAHWGTAAELRPGLSALLVRLPRLRELAVRSPGLTLHDAAALFADHGCLRRAVLAAGAEAVLESGAVVKESAVPHARRGLSIEWTLPNSYVPLDAFREDWVK